MARLDSSPAGLTREQAQARLAQYGPNELKFKRRSAWVRFLLQFHHPLIYVLLAAYLALTANLTAANWTVGAVVASLVTLLTPVSGPGLPVRRWPVAMATFVRYAMVLARDAMLSGVIVARAVLRPRLQIKPGFVEIPSHCRTPLGRAWSAHAITVTPGELVVELREDGTMLTHTLDLDRSAGSAARAESRHDEYLSKLLPGEQ